MSTFPAMLLLVVCTATPAATLAQATNSSSSITPTVDSQSLTILQASLRAMGGSVPSDSAAAGAVTTVAGGQTDHGTIRILTEGSGETSVEMAMPDATRTTVYANGQASESVGGVLTPLPLELAVTSKAPEFPVPFIAALLSDSDASLQYVGLESSEGQSVYHIRVWDSFASRPDLQPLASFSTHDIWIDTTSGLPQRIGYVRRPAHGAVAGVRVDIWYSAYKQIGGVSYPMTIEESLNGTPWATITIQSVSFDTGLSDRDFSLQ
jgi:hypothetical protein